METRFDGLIGEEYELHNNICPGCRIMAERIAYQLGQHKSKNEPTILEIGPGTGVLTLELLKELNSGKISAVDNEPKMLQRLEVHFAEHPPSIEIELVGSDCLDYLREQPSESFDAICSTYVMHNFLKPYRHEVFSEIFRILKPSGTLLNGDLFASADESKQNALFRAEAARYFDIFTQMGKIELAREWILHLIEDMADYRIMRDEPTLAQLRKIGFSKTEFSYRENFNGLLEAVK